MTTKKQMQTKKEKASKEKRENIKEINTLISLLWKEKTKKLGSLLDFLKSDEELCIKLRKALEITPDRITYGIIKAGSKPENFYTVVLIDGIPEATKKLYFSMEFVQKCLTKAILSDSKPIEGPEIEVFEKTGLEKAMEKYKKQAKKRQIKQAREAKAFKLLEEKEKAEREAKEKIKAEKLQALRDKKAKEKAEKELANVA